MVLKILHTGDSESCDQLLVDKGRGGGPQTWISKRGGIEKSHIQKTLNLSTNADSTIDSIIKLKIKQIVKGLIS